MHCESALLAETVWYRFGLCSFIQNNNASGLVESIELAGYGIL